MANQKRHPGDQNVARDENRPSTPAERSPDVSLDREDFGRGPGGELDRTPNQDIDTEEQTLGESTTASGVGEEDFGVGIGNTRVGAEDNKSTPRNSEKERLSKTKG